MGGEHVKIGENHCNLCLPVNPLSVSSIENEQINLNNMGVIQYNKGENDKALELYEKALKIYEKKKEENCFGAANTLHNMGVIYENKGETAKALELYERAVKIYEKTKDKSCS